MEIEMNAIRVKEFGSPEVLKYESLPDLHPTQGQVLVKVAAVGINPVEAYIRSGAYPRSPELPYTPGADCAGVVAETGSGVASCKQGDRVYTSGTITGAYAEFALCAERQIHQLPEAVTFKQGAALGVPYGTAYRALFHRARAVPGEFVLVHGATGGVGIAAVQLARAAGLTVIATGGTDRGRKLLKSEGVAHVLDHSQPGYLDAVSVITQGRGVDVILEMLANVNLANDLGILAKNGRVVVVGSRGNIEINPRELMSRDAAILGMTLFNAGESDLKSIHAALYAGLANNTLRPVIGKEFPLTDASAAHRAIMDKGAWGKIVLIP
jgi:NADPH2:quinone reductase